MIFKNILLVISLIFLISCDQSNLKTVKIDYKSEKKYQNSGFALIYNNNLKLKKLDQRSLKIFHKTLKARSQVKITNPLNQKSLIAEIKSNRVKFSNFYNSVVTDRIVEELDINPSEPFIEIILISKESTFIAGKAKTFDEEKKVAQKAPIDGIKISSLNISSEDIIKKKSERNFSYSIKVADFYYKKSAKLMINRIQTETSIKNVKLVKLSKTNYRVLLGPFNDIYSLKESFEKMNSLNFENLEIFKNV